MSNRRLCEGGVEIGTGPCRVCGRTRKESCGRPLPDPRDARIAELEAESIRRGDQLVRAASKIHDHRKRATEAEARVAELEAENEALHKRWDAANETFIKMEAERDRLLEQGIRMWQSGYARGHDDTVEGNYNQAWESDPEAAIDARAAIAKAEEE